MVNSLSQQNWTIPPSYQNGSIHSPAIFTANQMNKTQQKENKSHKILWGALILGAAGIATALILKKTSCNKEWANVKEATAYFKQKFNIDANFDKCGDMEYITSIKNALIKAKNMNCKLPNTIDFCSFKDNSINVLRNNYGLKPYNVPSQSYAHADEGCHVFFNSDAQSLDNIINKINSEKLGHFKSSSPNSQEVKEYIALHEFGHINARKTVLDYGYKSEYGGLPNEAVDNLFKNLIKYQNEMYTEVKPFNSGLEVIPETYAKLIANPKLEFSDKTMLLYDIMGGGAIPNRTIKGKPYAEYMKDLYTNWQKILL